MTSPLDRIEASIDSFWDQSPVPRPDHDRLAQWYVITVNEDLLRLVLRQLGQKLRGAPTSGGNIRIPFVAANLVEFGRSIPYRLRYALERVARVATPRSRLEFRTPRVAPSEYEKTASLLSLAATYDPIVRIFIAWRQNRLITAVSQDETVVDLKDLEHTEYSALDILTSTSDEYGGPPIVEWLSLQPHEWPPILVDIEKGARLRRPGAVEYRFNPALGARLAEHVRSPAVIPSTWSCAGFSQDDVSRILTAFRARCAYHVLSIWTGGRSDKGVGLESAAFRTTRDELTSDVSTISGVHSDVVGEMIRLLTHGHMTQFPDPALQPILDIGGDELLIPACSVVTYNVERNFLTLLARLMPRDFDGASSVFEVAMTESLLATIARRFPVYRRNYFPAGTAEEVDLLFADPSTRTLAICELRWTLQPADSREVTRRRTMCSEKAEQARRKINAVQQSLELVLRDLGLPSEPESSWTVAGIVVIDGFAGWPDSHSNPIPVVHQRVFSTGVGESRNASELFEWLRSSEWLPKEDKHYTLRPASRNFGAVEFRSRDMFTPLDGSDYWHDLEESWKRLETGAPAWTTVMHGTRTNHSRVGPATTR